MPSVFSTVFILGLAGAGFGAVAQAAEPLAWDAWPTGCGTTTVADDGAVAVALDLAVGARGDAYCHVVGKARIPRGFALVDGLDATLTADGAFERDGDRATVSLDVRSGTALDRTSKSLTFASSKPQETPLALEARARLPVTGHCERELAIAVHFGIGARTHATDDASTLRLSPRRLLVPALAVVKLDCPGM